MQSLNVSDNKDIMNTFAVFDPQKYAQSRSLLLQEKQKKDKFEKKYGMLYTAGTVAAGAGIVYALCRGGKLTSLTDKIKNYANTLYAKAMEKMKNNHSLDWFQRANLFLMVKTSNFLRKLQGFGNINPIKDIAVDRGLIKMEQKLKIKGKTFFDKITGYFIKYGKKLAGSKYKQPVSDLADFRKVLDKAILEIEKLSPDALKGQTPAQVAGKLRELSSLSDRELTSIVNGFGDRFDGMMQVLGEKAEKKFTESLMSARGVTRGEKIMNKINELSEFIPTREMKGEHKKIFSPLFRSRKAISNSIVDLHKRLSVSLDNLFYNDSVLQRHDLRGNYLNLQKILKDFLKPKKSGVARGITRGKLLEELNKTADNFRRAFPDGAKAEKIEDLIKLVESDKKGAVEEAVSLCKVLKDKNKPLYNELVLARNKFQKSFNNAVEFEADKSYRKMLDFSLHSLTTDLFTQAAGIGTVGYILANRKKSKKEKIPSILKSGIPVVGGLAVAFLCNLRQVASGPGSLFLAIVSGFALNRVGSVISDKYVSGDKRMIA